MDPLSQETKFWKSLTLSHLIFLKVSVESKTIHAIQL